MTAASDLTSLAQLIPASSRLVLDPGIAPGAKAQAGAAAGGSPVDYVMVPTSTIRPGDDVRVLPGVDDSVELDGVKVQLMSPRTSSQRQPGGIV